MKVRKIKIGEFTVKQRKKDLFINCKNLEFDYFTEYGTSIDVNKYLETLTAQSFLQIFDVKRPGEAFAVSDNVQLTWLHPIVFIDYIIWASISLRLHVAELLVSLTDIMPDETPDEPKEEKKKCNCPNCNPGFYKNMFSQNKDISNLKSNTIENISYGIKKVITSIDEGKEIDFDKAMDDVRGYLQDARLERKNGQNNNVFTVVYQLGNAKKYKIDTTADRDLKLDHLKCDFKDIKELFVISGNVRAQLAEKFAQKLNKGVFYLDENDLIECYEMAEK